ncbi:MAG: GtrA family protein [Acidimicrobiales bacterium]
METDQADAPGKTIVQYVMGLIKQKGFKYSLVSVVNVLFGGGLLLLLQTHMNPTEANVLSVMVSSVPAYYMNRAWVWGKRGKSHLKREVLPFWFFVVAGLILSTIAIHFAEDHTENKFVILFVQLCAFGVLWVLRFFLLDRLFHLEADAPPGDDEDQPAVDSAR